MRRNTTHTERERKKSICTQNFQVQICDQNFSNFLQFSSRHNSRLTKKTKEMVKITKSTRSLFLSCGSFSLLLSLSFVPMLRFLRVRILTLSPFKMRLCLCVCVRVGVCLERPDLRLGVLFPSQPQVFFSCALTCTDFVSSPYHLFIIFSFSLLHRRRLRRRTDHGHDRSEVPAHRGNTINIYFFVRR